MMTLENGAFKYFPSLRGTALFDGAMHFPAGRRLALPNTSTELYLRPIYLYDLVIRNLMCSRFILPRSSDVIPQLSHHFPAFDWRLPKRQAGINSLECSRHGLIQPAKGRAQEFLFPPTISCLFVKNNVSIAIANHRGPCSYFFPARGLGRRFLQGSWSWRMFQPATRVSNSPRDFGVGLVWGGMAFLRFCLRFSVFNLDF